MMLLAGLPLAAQMIPVASAPDVGSLSGPNDKIYTAADTQTTLRPAIETLTIDSTPLPTSTAPLALPPENLLAHGSASSSSAGPAALEPAPHEPAGPVTLPPRPPRDLPPLSAGDRPRIRPFQAAAFGLTASTLGAGAELAIPLSRTLNLRVGGSYMRESFPFNVDGIDYLPGLKFTSGRGSIDWFPHHGAFHISAGALYFRNTIAGTASVVEGQTFSLGGTNYINSVDDPVGGNASVVYGKQIAPMLLLGFGNILPRSGRHFSMPFEFGGAYMQAPTLNLKLSGTACTNQGCFNAATDPQVQANLAKEINTLQSDLRFLQVYPILSLGLACRF